jgi:SAM-dependent methyltransferase
MGLSQPTRSSRNSPFKSGKWYVDSIVSLSPTEQRRLAEHEKTYWWHVAKRNYFRSLFLQIRIDPSVHVRALDIGAAGGETRELLVEGTAFFLLEPALTETFRAAPEKRKVIARAEQLPFRSHSFELILAADVLEHIPDDDRAAQEIFQALTPMGYFVLSVPAHPWLFCAHDKALGHMRRYTKRALISVLDGSGLKIEFLSWTYATLLPAMVVRRILWPVTSNNPTSSYPWFPRWLNRLLIGWFGIEALLLRLARLPFGPSLFALVRRADRAMDPSNP